MKASIKTVLFVCIHNSARSQMAEAFVNHLAPESFLAQSAGLEPGRLNPIVVEAMKEVGIDISHHQTKSIQDIIKTGTRFDYVITVCDEASAERCPTVPGNGKKVHLGFPDPSLLEGTYEEKLLRTRQIRDDIRSEIHKWLSEERKG